MRTRHALMPLVAFVLLFFVESAFAAPAPNPTNFDIIGIKLGMSIDEVKAALTTHDKSINTESISVKTKQGDQITQLIHAFQGRPVHETPNSPKKYDVSENIAVLFTETKPQKALLISRALVFTASDAPTSKNLVDQFVGKYSLPSSEDLIEGVGAGFVSWVFDSHSRLLNGSGQTLGENGIFSGPTRTPSSYSCMTHGAELPLALRFPPDFGNVGLSAAPVIYYASFNQSCGVSLVLRITAANEIVQLFTETLTNDQMAIADIKSAADAVKARQQQQRAKASAAPPSKL